MSTKSRTIEDTYPLSPLQEGLLFHSLLAPDSGVYVTQVTCTLRNLNVPALERAWRQVTDRQPILRTAFVWKNLDRPLQVVGRKVGVPLERQDWRGMSALDQAERFAAYLEADRRRGFKISKAPLMRLALFQVAEDTYRFVWSHHHILLDGWSVHHLIKEVFVLYEGLCRGQAIRLEPIRTYRDYIAWLRQQDLALAESYWRRALRGFQAPTSLGVGRANGCASTRDESPGEQRVRLSADTTAALQSLARRSQLTLNTLVQGAWALLLSRYSGEEDVTFGAVVSGRPAELPGVEKIVGLFINTLPVRVKVEPGAQLLSWLRELQEQQVEMRRFEYSPLVQVQGWSGAPRDLPLFESLFAFENYPVEAPALGSQMSLEAYDYHVIEKVNYPLALIAGPGQELALKILYDPHRFDSATTARTLKHLQNLLEDIVANPEQRLSDIRLLTETERRQLLVEWNDTETHYPKDRCIQDLFEEQVERNPEAIAVVFQDEQLSYYELNRRANQLAAYLGNLGVGPETPVGFCLARSPEMVVGILGILKAGGTYVPLDPAYPKERLAFMLEDTRTPVILVQQKLIERLPEHQARVVRIDADWGLMARESEANRASGATAGHLAYVMYTSGSTGRPKGIAIPHRAINRLVFNTNYIEMTSEDRMALASNSAFDAATFELWGALLHGARLVGISRDVALSPADLATEIRAQGISAMFLTTALFNQIAREVPAAFGSVRSVLFGGEAVDLNSVKEVLKHNPPARLLHVYGPTESTTFTTWYPVQGLPEGAVTAPIGRPLANTQVYLLDGSLQPAPVGVGGELYIGGDGLAWGYFMRPELTAEKFIPNPFSQEPGARLYRTGDLARYWPDGAIEFLERLDQQVKIRGFRIELGEIEAVLDGHPAVRETVVLAQEERPGEKRLVAYLIANQNAELSISELRDLVGEKLPDYMMPSVFMTLESLPLTPNGKVDRKALPQPEWTRPELESAFKASRNATEEMLTGIWTVVLGLDRVGVHDNFFELGGHSLVAIRIISRVREAFKVELALRDLFEIPTVAGLTKKIETLMRVDQGLQAPPIERVTRDGKLPLSFGQQRLWFLDKLAQGSSFYNVSSLFRVNGKLDVAAMEWSLNEIVRRHEVLRTTFSSVGGQPIQAISPAVSLTLPLIDLTELSEGDRDAEGRRLTVENTNLPFDLARGPLFRATLLRLGAEDHIFLFTTHHIIFDGWSSGVLVREFSTLYKVFTEGSSSPLPDLPLQYADFAHWQRHWVQGEVLENLLSYWKTQLSGSTPVLELPTDRPRPAFQTFRGATQPINLPKGLSESLKELSRCEGATLFMTLLAAFQTLLHRYSGQNDILVGSPIAGRTQAPIEDLIGFFVNTLVLRTDFSGDPTFQEMLGEVRKVTLEAYAHQDLPFEQLVDALQPDRALSHSPLFQVMFVLQNTTRQTLELPGLTLSSLQTEGRTAKFDLTLYLTDTERGLSGILEYNTDLFDPATATQMERHFQTLLAHIIADPQQRISNLTLMAEPEQRQLIVEWNDTESDYPLDQCIHQLFEAQVARTPEAIAAVFEDEQLTYNELSQRANQLARHLQKLGVGPAALVGICVERSPEMLIGLLGILKAGGAYVPLDPAYPKERLAFMLQDTQAPVLLTNHRLVERMIEDRGSKVEGSDSQSSNITSILDHSCQVVCLDNDWQTISQNSRQNLVCEVRADNLAYVIYTSGSTGKPKGVQIPHRAVANFLESMRKQPGLTAMDTLLSVTTLSFDIAALELFLPITVGARVVVVSREVAADGDRLKELIASGVTVMQATPATWRLLLEADWQGSKRLKILCGGEALSRELADHLLEMGLSLWNLYGPTETTIWSAVNEVGPGHGLVSIGRPIPNTQIYILDRHLQPLPIGVPGELHIGGDGLSEGYLKRPELTAEKFVPNPYSREPGARLYKTGDMARFLSNADIEVLGRIDHQVKIRGFRIELGEIEATLSQHPAVQHVVVLAQEDKPGDLASHPGGIGASKRLVAYVVPNQESVPTPGELRSFLKEKLPEYMTPSAFLILEKLPLTPNGKVDRHALPKDDGIISDQKGLIAPRSPVEEMLAEIWTEVLGLEQFSVHDNFFELGGHSLLATRSDLPAARYFPSRFACTPNF